MAAIKDGKSGHSSVSGCPITETFTFFLNHEHLVTIKHFMKNYCALRGFMTINYLAEFSYKNALCLKLISIKIQISVFGIAYFIHKYDRGSIIIEFQNNAIALCIA